MSKLANLNFRLLAPGDKIISNLRYYPGELLIMSHRNDLLHSHIIFYDAIYYDDYIVSSVLLATIDNRLYSATDLVIDNENNILIVTLNYNKFYKSLERKPNNA